MGDVQEVEEVIQADETQSGESKEPRLPRHIPSSYNGKTRERAVLGKFEETLRAVYELPPVNSVVRMWDLVYSVHNQGEEALDANDTAGSKLKLRPLEGCKSESGEIKEFLVAGYTHGVEYPLDSRNKILLECVFPKKSRGLGKTSVPTLWISTGSVRAEVVSEVYDARKYEDF